LERNWERNSQRENGREKRLGINNLMNFVRLVEDVLNEKKAKKKKRREKRRGDRSRATLGQYWGPGWGWGPYWGNDSGQGGEGSGGDFGGGGE
jgi:hypothetical protein